MSFEESVMNGESGVRFDHDIEVIRFAYRLVAEYDKHNREQNKKFYNDEHPELKVFEPGTIPKNKRGYVK
jgi:hypothetical protein